MGLTTKFALPYPEPPNPADVPADMSALATRIDSIGGAANGLSTLDAGGKVPLAQLPNIAESLPTPSPTPPPAPVDGQLWTLLSANDATGVVWVFRYRAGSASTYKWEFVGGAPWSFVIAATQTLGVANQWTNLGPVTLPLPRAGEYHLSAYCSVAIPAAGVASPYLGIYAGTPANNLAALNATGNATWSLSLSIVKAKPPAQSAGAAIGLSGFGPVGTAYAAGGSCSIEPIRIM